MSRATTTLQALGEVMTNIAFLSAYDGPAYVPSRLDSRCT